MRTRPLGRSGLVVSEVGFGCLPIGGGFYGPADDAESAAAIASALALGCTFFDTADVYGKSERVLGAAIAGRRDAVIATKAGLASPDGHRPERLRASLDASLERLGLPRAALFQLHDPPRDVLLDPKTHAFLLGLVSEKKARAIGASVVSVADGLAAVECGKYDAIQVEVNLLAPEAARELLQRAKERGVGVIAKVPLDHGVLSGKYGIDARFGPEDVRAQAPPAELAWRARALEELSFLWGEGTGRTPAQAALRWLLDQDGLSTVIPGVKTASQAEEAMGASDVSPLSADERARVDSLQRRGWR